MDNNLSRGRGGSSGGRRDASDSTEEDEDDESSGSSSSSSGTTSSAAAGSSSSTTPTSGSGGSGSSNFNRPTDGSGRSGAEPDRGDDSSGESNFQGDDTSESSTGSSNVEQATSGGSDDGRSNFERDSPDTSDTSTGTSSTDQLVSGTDGDTSAPTPDQFTSDNQDSPTRRTVDRNPPESASDDAILQSIRETAASDNRFSPNQFTVSDFERRDGELVPVVRRRGERPGDIDDVPDAFRDQLREDAAERVDAADFEDTAVVVNDGGGIGVGFSEFAIESQQRTEAASEFDKQFPGVDIGTGDVRLTDDGARLAETAQAQIATQQIVEDSDQVGPDGPFDTDDLVFGFEDGQLVDASLFPEAGQDPRQEELSDALSGDGVLVSTAGGGRGPRFDSESGGEVAEFSTETTEQRNLTGEQSFLDGLTGGRVSSALDAFDGFRDRITPGDDTPDEREIIDAGLSGLLAPAAFTSAGLTELGDRATPGDGIVRVTPNIGFRPNVDEISNAVPSADVPLTDRLNTDTLLEQSETVDASVFTDAAAATYATAPGVVAADRMSDFATETASGTDFANTASDVGAALGAGLLIPGAATTAVASEAADRSGVSDAVQGETVADVYATTPAVAAGSRAVDAVGDSQVGSVSESGLENAAGVYATTPAVVAGSRAVDAVGDSEDGLSEAVADGTNLLTESIGEAGSAVADASERNSPMSVLDQPGGDVVVDPGPNSVQGNRVDDGIFQFEEVSRDEVSGLEAAAATVATRGVAVPEARTTIGGAALLGGLAAASEVEDQFNGEGDLFFSGSELEIGQSQQDVTEVGVGSSTVNEIEVGEPTVQELGIGSPRTDMTELDVGSLSETGSELGVPRTTGLLQEEQERPFEDVGPTPITPEEIEDPFGDIEQDPPSTRERQRRDDLDTFEREFPTGGGAVIDESIGSDFGDDFGFSEVNAGVEVDGAEFIQPIENGVTPGGLTPSPANLGPGERFDESTQSIVRTDTTTQQLSETAVDVMGLQSPRTELRTSSLQQPVQSSLASPTGNPFESGLSNNFRNPNVTGGSNSPRRDSPRQMPFPTFGSEPDIPDVGAPDPFDVQIDNPIATAPEVLGFDSGSAGSEMPRGDVFEGVDPDDFALDGFDAVSFAPGGGASFPSFEDRWDDEDLPNGWALF